MNAKLPAAWSSSSASSLLLLHLSGGGVLVCVRAAVAVGAPSHHHTITAYHHIEPQCCFGQLLKTNTQLPSQLNRIIITMGELA